jgi:hypothetical protein
MAIQFFYCQKKGFDCVPLSSREVVELAKTGKLNPDDLIRLDGSSKWMPASKIKNLVFRNLQAEPEEEIGTTLVIDPEPIPPTLQDLIERNRRWGQAETTAPIGHLGSPITPALPIGQPNNPIPAPNDNLPPPPDYGFVQTVATMYNTMGVLTLIGSFFGVLIIGSKDSGGRDSGGQKESLIFGLIIFGAITSITMFAMAQLFTMAINGSKNLHYIMHSNMVAMRVIINQFSKKE